MKRLCAHWLTRVGTAMWCAGLSISAPAAPPANKALVLSTETRHPPHLDLRPPTTGAYAGIAAPTGQARRGLAFRADPSSSDDRHAFSAFESPARQPPIVGRAQAIVQRFRHEGLPVARLWENRSAFVSLGLNGRGKPGIWLVQKTH